MTIHHEVSGVTLHHGDCLTVLTADTLGYDYRLGYAPPAIPDASVDAVVTDPPYGLGFMGKEWDSGKSFVERKAAKRNTFDHVGGNHNPANSQDQQRTYLRENAAFGAWCEEWARECLRVLKPGGHILAFGGSRTWHRLAVAIEDAGFEVRDSIAWLYGSGFPKSMDVSKAIDKQDAVDERQSRALRFTSWLRTTGLTTGQIDEVTSSHMGGHYLTQAEQAAIPTRQMFELIRPLLAGKPVPSSIEELIDQRTVESENFKARPIVGERTTGISTGKGSVSVITDNPENRAVTEAHTDAARRWQGWGTALKPAFEPIVVGRKPLAGTVASNVLEYGTGALNIDGCRLGGDQAYRDKCASVVGLDSNRNGDAYGAWPEPREDSAHALGRWPANVALNEAQAEALDEQTASMGGVSQFYYVAKSGAEERPRVDGIAHPTVKPLELMRWLVRLVTPPGGTVLEPFAGSGTTVEACMAEGFRVVAVEREEDYLPLILARIERARLIGRGHAPEVYTRSLKRLAKPIDPDEGSFLDLMKEGIDA